MIETDVIAAGARPLIGKHMGSLSGLSAAELRGGAIPAALCRGSGQGTALLLKR